MRIATWNINSVRIRLDSLSRMVEARQPDVICLQETKVIDSLFPFDAIKELGYAHIEVHGQKGYNGVAILSRVPLDRVERRVWWGKDDRRHISATLPNGIELHNFYVPSGGPTADPEANEKFAHKLGFLEEMADWTAENAKDRPILLVGDLNVAPLDTDVWNHKRLTKSVGHTPGECERLLKVISAGEMFDVPRHFVPPSEPLYSWWGYRFKASVEKNYGWRLDHAIASSFLKERFIQVETYKDTRIWEKPSDHVPVILDIAD